MKLDRHINANGKGKYALINLRKITSNPQTAQELSAAILAAPECVEFGRVGEPDEFFVIKLKDKYVFDALMTYGASAKMDGEIEYGNCIFRLADRSGYKNPNCKKPD